MSYTYDQFNACIFNPLTKEKMLQAYPALKEIVQPEWEQESIDAILRFVVICYDSKSPVVATERDYTRKKVISYELAGIKNMDEDSDIIAALTIQYLIKFIRQKEYAALCAFEYKFYENISELMTPVKGDTNAERLEAAKKKSVISEEIILDIKRIDDLWLQVLGEKDLVEIVKRKNFKPEMMGAWHV